MQYDLYTCNQYTLICIIYSQSHIDKNIKGSLMESIKQLRNENEPYGPNKSKAVTIR